MPGRVAEKPNGRGPNPDRSHVPVAGRTLVPLYHGSPLSCHVPCQIRPGTASAICSARGKAWSRPPVRSGSPPSPDRRRRRRSFACRCTAAPRGAGDVVQMVRTVREILLARLDDIGATRLWPLADRSGLDRSAWLRMYQEMLLALFPEECGDGEPYVPNPAERMDLPPGVKVRVGGLFPYPCEGVGDARSAAFARHLLAGMESPIAGMTDGDGARLFTDAELARLGERIERRTVRVRA